MTEPKKSAYNTPIPSPLSGYVCGQEERRFRVFALIFATPLLLGFDIFLWFSCFNSQSLGSFICTVVFTCFLIIMVIINVKIRAVDDLWFAIQDSHILNQSNHNSISIDLDTAATIYCTKETREFAYGKSTQNKVFYLFSDHPFSAEHIYGEGLFFLKHLHQHNILIVPETPQTTVWLVQKFGNTTIPKYPRVACLLSARRTGDGSV